MAVQFDEWEYDPYALVGFIFGLLYIIFTLIILFVSPNSLNTSTRDYINGIFLAAFLFGAPVIIFLGIMGAIYSSIEHKKGKILGITAIAAPLVFIAALFFIWYPAKIGFWDYNFSPVKNIQEISP